MWAQVTNSFMHLHSSSGKIGWVTAIMDCTVTKRAGWQRFLRWSRQGLSLGTFSASSVIPTHLCVVS